MSIEAMKQALEALENHTAIKHPQQIYYRDAAIESLRAAIEQAEKREGWMPRAVLFENGEPIAHRELTEQEPVAWMYDFLNSDNRDEVIRDWMTQDYADIKRENGFNVRPLYTAPQYDQTALELCEECGWRAMIPSDGCLVCARQKATPVWIPRVHLEAAQREPSMCRVEPTKRLPDFVPLYTAPPAVTQKPVAYVDQRIHGWPDCFVMEPDPPHTVPLYTEPPTDSEPFAYAYTGIRQDGSIHGPHLIWKPEYMDAMSASKGAVAVPLYAAPPATP